MENTEKVLFADDSTPQWYIALGDRWVGPLTATDVYERVVAQEISWAHYVWKPGEKEWRRICDVKTFQAAVPTVPAKSVQSEVKEHATPPHGTKAPPPAPKVKKAEKPVRHWYLHYNDSQFGPFSTEEVDRYLSVGKIHGRVHAWREGMDNWERLERIDRFAEGVAAAKKAREAKAASKGGAPSVAKAAKAAAEAAAASQVREQREAPRRPLVARILLANDETVITSVCRDISVGGMQVLTDRIPGIVGTKLRMNVTSTNNSLTPFVAEGVIVRILEDGRGFSFRFERLPDDSRRAIESYISGAA